MLWRSTKKTRQYAVLSWYAFQLVLFVHKVQTVLFSAQGQKGHISNSIHKKPNSELVIKTEPKIQAAAAPLTTSVKRLIIFKYATVTSNTFIFKDKFKNKDQQLTPLWSDEFSSVIDLPKNKNWKHVIGVSQTGFQYYSSHNENRWNHM